MDAVMSCETCYSTQDLLIGEGLPDECCYCFEYDQWEPRRSCDTCAGEFGEFGPGDCDFCLDHSYWTAKKEEKPVPNGAKAGAPYPDDNPKTVLGTAKPGLSAVPPVGMLHLGRAMADGERKYGLMNYRDKSVSSNVYYNAAMRHLMAWWDGEQNAPDSGVHHLGHVMACCAILLDAEAHGSLNDNRPTPGTFAKLVAQFTEKDNG